MKGESAMTKSKLFKLTAVAGTAAALMFTCAVNPADAYAGETYPAATTEESATTPENGWSADSMYWCENGIKQGLEGRGKEIYDPASDPWYWLDAADNGKKAVSKDVYQESDGGKWVRYDENGHMVKGWNLNTDGLYYFAPVTGEMLKETVNINGASYQFDGVTGTSISVEYPVAELNQESDGQRFIDSSKESLILDGDTWHCYKDGQIDYEYDGIALNEYGWWKINDGTVDFNYTGMVQNENGWWYVKDGCVDWTYSGMALNKYGWWKYNNGFVDFGYTGIALNDYGWWKFTNGSVDFNANGLVFDEATNTWWYFNGGAIDFAFDGMALNDYGWWKVNNGSVNFGFNGLCSNEYGTWKFNDGTVDFGYNGAVDAEDGRWYVAKGRVRTNKPNVEVIDGQDGPMYGEAFYYRDGQAIGYGENVYQGADLELDYPMLTVTTRYVPVKVGEFRTAEGYYYIALDELGLERVTGSTLDYETGHYNCSRTKVGTYSCGDVWFCAYKD